MLSLYFSFVFADYSTYGGAIKEHDVEELEELLNKENIRLNSMNDDIVSFKGTEKIGFVSFHRRPFRQDFYAVYLNERSSTYIGHTRTKRLFSGSRLYRKLRKRHNQLLNEDNIGDGRYISADVMFDMKD